MGPRSPSLLNGSCFFGLLLISSAASSGTTLNFALALRSLTELKPSEPRGSYVVEGSTIGEWHPCELLRTRGSKNDFTPRLSSWTSARHCVQLDPASPPGRLNGTSAGFSASTFSRRQKLHILPFAENDRRVEILERSVLVS